MAHGDVDADRGNGESNEQRCKVACHRGTADEDCAAEPERRQPERFVAREAGREAGELRSCNGKHDHPDDTAEDSGKQRDEQRGAWFAGLGQRVAVLDIGSRGGSAGHLEQRPGDVASEDRGGGGGDDGSHRLRRAHEIGEGHQQRDRHGCGEPGHRADEGAVERAQQNRRHEVRLEHGGEDRKNVHDQPSTRPTGLAGPMAAAPAARCRTRNAG